MFELFKNMIKEEWRTHSTIFGSVSFGLFPLFIVFVSFLFSLSSNVFTLMFSDKVLTTVAHYLFFFFGVNVGAFGLMGKEFMNRRFGNFSSVAYSSRTLPVSEKTIFINEVFKDILYYFFMWIIPIILGFSIFLFFFVGDVSIIPSLLLSLSLSFLIGLSVVFFLSMIYANSSRGFMLFLAFAGSFLFFAYRMYTRSFSNMLYDFFPLRFFFYGQTEFVLYSVLLVILLIAVSLAIVKVDFPVRTGKHKFLLHRLESFFEYIKFGKYSKFVAKDFLDMSRSNGGLGKMIFSFFFPVGFVWLFLNFFTKYIPQADFLTVFSVFLGVFSASFYSWITEYDMFNQYLFFPVRVSHIMKEKILSYVLLNIIPILTIFFAAIIKHELPAFVFALLIFLITSFYALSMTMLLTGLSPSIMFLNVKNIVVYFIFIIPVMLGFIFIYLFSLLLLLFFSLAILIVSMVLLYFAFRRWDNKTQSIF